MVIIVKNCKFIIIALLMMTLSGVSAYADDTSLYISSAGSDTNDGKSAEYPIKTFEMAEEIIKRDGLISKGNVYLNVCGEYVAAQTINISNMHGGTNNIIIQSAPGEKAKITSQVSVSVSELSGVSDEKILQRLPEEARDKVRQIPLESFGMKNKGRIWHYTNSFDINCLVFADGQLLEIARWPNSGFAYTKNVFSDTSSGGENSKLGFDMPDERAKSWVSASDALWYGAPEVLWDWRTIKFADISSENGTVTLDYRYSEYSKESYPYFVYNLLEELDREGEYYIDYKNNMLYIISPTGSEYISMSVNGNSLMQLSDSSNIKIKNIDFCNTSTIGVSISKCEDIEISGCNMYNMGRCGIKAEEVMRFKADGCTFYKIGHSAISVEGGERNTLTPSDSVISNCEIYDSAQFMYSGGGGIIVKGVGITVLNNKIYSMPHWGISFYGNDHIVKGNEVYDVCKLSEDCSAIGGGGDWTYRGCVIENNYLHDIIGYKKEAKAIYIDNMGPDVKIRNNLFAFCSRGVFIHGGSDHRIYDNLFVSCGGSVEVGTFSFLGQERFFDRTSGKFFTDAAKVPYDSGIWQSRYPELYELMHNATDEALQYPRNNEVYGNTMINTPDVVMSDLARQYGKEYKNTVKQALFYKEK